MKSLVYDLNGEIFNNESFQNPIGYYEKDKNQLEYNKLIKQIYNNEKLRNDSELLEYLERIDDINCLKAAIKVFSFDFIRNDKNLFEVVKGYGYYHMNMISEEIDSVLKNNINIFYLKRTILNLSSLKDGAEKFLKFIIKNTNYLSDQTFELLLEQAKMRWDIHIGCNCEKILQSQLIKDKKQILNYFFQINDMSSNGQKNMYAFSSIVNMEGLANNYEEIKKLVYLANEVKYTDSSLNEYIKIYKFPEIYNNSKLREYLFNILKISIKEGMELTNMRYKIVLEACLNEKIRSNEVYLDAFMQARSWQHCYLLNNVFNCDEITSNKELMGLILSMPNYWCLEQLLLAYETHEINKDINVLKRIAYLVPFAEKMEEVRLGYGYNEFELQWLRNKEVYFIKQNPEDYGISITKKYKS